MGVFCFRGGRYNLLPIRAYRVQQPSNSMWCHRRLTFDNPNLTTARSCSRLSQAQTLGAPMSKESAEHHTKAAEHHEHAARHHKEAAKHHQSGSHEKAAHHAHVAHGHHLHATEHANEAAQHHLEAHGSK